MQFQPSSEQLGARWWGAGSHRDDSWQLSRTLLRCSLNVFSGRFWFLKSFASWKDDLWKCMANQLNYARVFNKHTVFVMDVVFKKPTNKVTVVGGWGWSMPHVTFDHMKGHVLTTLGRPARAGHRMTWSAWQKSKRAAGVGMWKHHITTYLEIIK